MIDLEQFPEHLSSMDKAGWERLFSFIPKLESAGSFGKLEADKDKDGNAQLPYVKLERVAEELLTTLYELDLLPNFDWRSWDESNSLLKRQAQLLDSSDTITLFKLLTVIIRTDKFIEGNYLIYLENGTVSNILKAIASKHYK